MAALEGMRALGVSGGGVLHLDPGMGKTAIVVRHIQQSAGVALVVAPLAVVDQWVQEFRDAGVHDVVIFHGPDRKRLKPGAVILSTYAIMSKGHLRQWLAKHGVEELAVLALDEGHLIRNLMSTRPKVATEAIQLRRLAAQRWIMTGTLLNNRKEDVISAAVFVRREPFNLRDFWDQPDALAQFKRGAVIYQCLADAPDMRLPPRSLVTHTVELSREERAVYDELIAEGMATFETWSRCSGGFEKARLRQELITHILRLRQVCIACCLLNTNNEEEEAEEAEPAEADELDIAADVILHKSSKIRAVHAAVLEALRQRPGRKVVVFSQFVGALRILRRVFPPEDTCMYTGALSASERAGVLRDFQARKSILLMSQRAGGMGLNLTCADMTFIVEPDFNPQAEAQAEARVFRIGQALPVTSVRFICGNTVESWMHAMQDLKLKAAQAFLADAAAPQLPDEALLCKLFDSTVRMKKRQRV